MSAITNDTEPELKRLREQRARSHSQRHEIQGKHRNCT
jgi:hypothetical protein